MSNRSEEEIIECINDLKQQLHEVLKEKRECILNSISCDPKPLSTHKINNYEIQYKEMLKSAKRPRIDFRREKLREIMEFNKYTGIYLSQINSKHLVIKYEIYERSGHNMYYIEILLRNDAVAKVGRCYLPEGINPRKDFSKENFLPWIQGVFDQCRFYHYIKNQISEIEKKESIELIHSVTCRVVYLGMDVVLINGPHKRHTLKIKLHYNLLSHLPYNCEIYSSTMNEEELRIAKEQFCYFSNCEINDAIAASLNEPMEDKFILVEDLKNFCNETATMNSQEELIPLEAQNGEWKKNIMDWVRKSCGEQAEDRIAVTEVENDEEQNENQTSNQNSRPTQNREIVEENVSSSKKNKSSKKKKSKKHKQDKLSIEKVKEVSLEKQNDHNSNLNIPEKTNIPENISKKPSKLPKCNTPLQFKQNKKLIATSTPRPFKSKSKIPKPIEKVKSQKEALIEEGPNKKRKKQNKENKIGTKKKKL